MGAMQQTRAITHISLGAANSGKLAALDALWEVYRALCQQYISYFCTQAEPDPHMDFVFGSVLSARWQRVAVQQAAGIAQSWRTNRRAAWQEHEERLAHYASLPADERTKRLVPTWQEW